MIKIFFLATCASLASYFFWTKVPPLIDEKEKQAVDLFQKVSDDLHLKHILLWTYYKHAPFYFFEEGQTAFIKNKCPHINCYATTDRTLFGGDVSMFHAVAMNGRTMSFEDMPKERSPHQKYIYFNMESADRYPVCDEKYDGFFNWTSTYKLDSDIPFPYIAVTNKQGDIIGPQKNMRWLHEFPEVNDKLAAKLANKTKAAAWFVSNCKSKSGREHLVKNLQRALKPYGHKVDIFGICGTLQCPRNQFRICDDMVKNEYFFYMSLENSFAEDYVTEKLLRAFQNDAVPIVLGGADYTRFVPPGSYLKLTDTEKLAATMDHLMKTPEEYRQYFRWKSQYAHIDPTMKENVCAVCAALNNKEKFEAKCIYNQFRKWWNPQHYTGCKKEF